MGVKVIRRDEEQPVVMHGGVYSHKRVAFTSRRESSRRPLRTGIQKSVVLSLRRVCIPV